MHAATAEFAGLWLICWVLCWFDVLLCTVAINRAAKSKRGRPTPKQ